VQLAIHYPNFSFAGGAQQMAQHLAATAKAADEGGAATLTLMDHWFQLVPLGGPEEPMLEGYCGLAFAAAHTQRIELGLLVTGVTYRHPGLLAKTVATLDVLSGGRAMLGLGAAWYEREHEGLGVPYPPIAERFEHLEEALQICAQMFGPGEGPYEGRHFRLSETICRPAPLQDRVPVVVGGNGERKTLRLVARYGDACNLTRSDPDTVRHKLEVLDRHCEAEGRDPAEIERTVLGMGDAASDPDGFLRNMEVLAGLGVQKVWVSPRGPEPAAWVAQVCEDVLPRLEQLG